MLYQEFVFFLQLFNHYSELKNRWGLYRLESKQKNKYEMGKQLHCVAQTCTPGVNYTLMESGMRACIHKHSHHFGGIKYMHMHNEGHEGMRPYVLLGKCILAHMFTVRGDQPALASLLRSNFCATPPFLNCPFSTFIGRLLTSTHHMFQQFFPTLPHWFFCLPHERQLGQQKEKKYIGKHCLVSNS